MNFVKSIVIALIFSAIAATSQDQIVDKKTPALEGEKQVITEANSAGSTDRVIYFNSDEVSAAFKKGTTSLIKFSNYKVLASHREVPGIPEVHLKDTDVFYVLEGSATLVTGGTVVGGRPIGSDEIRGKQITGGIVYKLNKGDVIIIPKNTPHWFKQVTGPLYYFAVKITS